MIYVAQELSEHVGVELYRSLVEEALLVAVVRVTAAGAAIGAVVDYQREPCDADHPAHDTERCHVRGQAGRAAQVYRF